MYAEATLEALDRKTSFGVPIPVRCQWFRVKQQRTYHIDSVSSNVYQLTAEDVGCVIKVEVTPSDPEDASGTAYGTFGPVKLDPGAR